MNKRQFCNEEASFNLLKRKIIKNLASVMSICYSTKSGKGAMYNYMKTTINNELKFWLAEETFHMEYNLFAEPYLIIEFGKNYKENIFNVIMEEFFEKYPKYTEFKRYFSKMREYKGENYGM